MKTKKRELAPLNRAEANFVNEKANDIELRKAMAFEIKGDVFIEDIHELQQEVLRNLREALNSPNENIRAHTAIKVAPYLFATKKEVTHTHRTIDDLINNLPTAEFKEVDDTGNADISG